MISVLSYHSTKFLECNFVIILGPLTDDITVNEDETYVSISVHILYCQYNWRLKLSMYLMEINLMDLFTHIYRHTTIATIANTISRYKNLTIHIAYGFIYMVASHPLAQYWIAISVRWYNSSIDPTKRENKEEKCNKKFHFSFFPVLFHHNARFSFED